MTNSKSLNGSKSIEVKMRTNDAIEKFGQDENHEWRIN
jgi:hypothetical protein